MNLEDALNALSDIHAFYSGLPQEEFVRHLEPAPILTNGIDREKRQVSFCFSSEAGILLYQGEVPVAVEHLDHSPGCMREELLTVPRGNAVFERSQSPRR